MNLFVVPSWYPHRCFPFEGIFIREQATAIGELRPAWNVAISLWGQGRGRLSLSHLRASPRCPIDHLRAASPSERELARNVVEFHTAAWSWNERWLGGNRDGILGANRRNLERAVRRFGSIDLLHAHVSYPAGWVGMRLSEATGIPCVITEHMGPFPLPVYARRDGALPEFIRRPLERATARIVVSRTLARRFEELGLPPAEVVPNLIDERRYDPEPHAPRDRFVFFTLASMVPGKGHDHLLRAIAAFVAGLPEPDRARVEFRLGGDGPLLEAHRAECRRLGIDRWVTWLGYVTREQARGEFHACDCYVLPSLHESFGIVLVEALASGRPVIATRCGGPEAIVDSSNGLLVEPGAPGELAAALARMLATAAGYDPRALRESALRLCSRSVVVDRLEAICRRILRDPGGPSREAGARTGARG